MNVPSPSLSVLTHSLARSRAEIGKVIVGQEMAIDLALLVIITGNHALIEGVPGLGKTLLVRTLARVLGCDFNRIQFTPDLMPADITGTNVFNLQRHEFNLVPGPVFTSFLLADEINRAPAKTQSALLQAMQERQVTIDRETHLLSPAFTVFATQNPVEYEGTYPLPEAQRDRFMLKIILEYPPRSEELQLARRFLGRDAPEAVLAAGAVEEVLPSGEIIRLREALQEVTLRDEIASYIVDVIRATRSQDSVLVGGGPRAMQALLLGSRAHAALRGRDYVTPDDVKTLALPVLGHRLILRPEVEIEGINVREVVESVLQSVAVPR
jgi:MoxR-like ATPase